MDFEKMVQKAVNAEVKVGLWFSTIVWELDICCHRSHYSSNSTASKVQIQGTNTKETKFEESKPKELKSAKGKNPILPRSKSTKPKKTFCTDKKREYLKKKREQKNNILAIGDNANAIKGGEKKWNNQGNERYYNY